MRPPDQPLLAGRHETPARPPNPPASARGEATKVFLATAGLALTLFEFYAAAYRTRHLTLPVGFDTSWYVWRAQYVAAEGLGRLGTPLRPGHALLSSVLGSMTGLSQLELAVVLPLVVVPLLALAVGAFVRTCFGVGRTGWAITVAVAGALLGTTRLVGENVANLLNLALIAGALVLVARRVAGERGFIGAVALLVAAGLAHWMFLAVGLAALGVSAALALPESLRQRAAGRSFLSTEAGTVGAVTATAGAVMAATIVGILRAPFTTFEVREDPSRFVPKLRTDVRRLMLPFLGPLAAIGVAGLLTGAVDEDPARALRPARSFGIHVVLAWTAVSGAGIAYGALTHKLPPHRFLAFLVAVPGAVAVATPVVWAARWVRRRAGRRVAGAVAAATVLAAAIPGAIAWYHHGPAVWIDPSGFQESLIASRYVERLPAGRPVVFLVSTSGPAGVLSVPLKERLIRMALPPGREPDVHLFVGDPADLVAGRRTIPRNERTNQATLPYWQDVRTVLPQRPPVIIVRSLAGRQFAEAVGTMGAAAIGPGVALLQGAPPPAAFAAEPLPRPVPRQPALLLWGGVILALLLVVGWGWTYVLAGPGAPAEVRWSLALSVGAAVIMLGAMIPARLGLHMGGPTGVAVYVALTLTGTAAAAASMRSVAGVTAAQSSHTGS